jgi:hypothetical protein
VADIQARMWYFRSRSVHPFYADVHARPTAAPGRFHFPGDPPVATADLPERWGSRREFRGEP